MEAIFQQAKFDEKLDEQRCFDVFKEISDRLKRDPSSYSSTCNRYGSFRRGISNVMDCTFTCEICLTKEELDRRYK